MLGDSKYIGYDSELGQLIKSETLHERPFVKFEKITANVFPIFRSNSPSSLSSDQDHFYKTCLALIHGDEEHIAAVKGYKLGKIGHARWLTTMNRIAIIYMSTKKPSKELKILTQFGVKVYGSIFFEIKKNPSFTEGPRIFLEIAKRCMEKTPQGKFVFPNYVGESVRATLNQNSYWAHPENILLAMICDKDESVRERGIGFIGTVRKNFLRNKRNEEKEREKAATAKPKRGRPKKPSQPEVVRAFHKPTDDNGANLNYYAMHYSEMLDLSQQVYEPPMTKGFTLEQLRRFKAPALSNHSQIVEHYVQEVSKEALEATSEDARNANVLVSTFFRKYLKGQKLQDRIPHLQEVENLRIMRRKPNYQTPDIEVNVSLDEIFLSPSVEVHHDVEINSDNGSSEEDFLDLA